MITYESLHKSLMDLLAKMPEVQITEHGEQKFRDACEALVRCEDDLCVSNAVVGLSGVYGLVTIELVCDDIVLEHGRSSSFFEAISGASSVCFSSSGESPVATIVFNDLLESTGDGV